MTTTKNWKLEVHPRRPRPFAVVNEFGNIIAYPDSEDDGRLMAAAPIMLDALQAADQLQTVRDSLTTWGHGDSFPAQVLDNIIAAHRTATAAAVDRRAANAAKQEEWERNVEAAFARIIPARNGGDA